MKTAGRRSFTFTCKEQYIHDLFRAVAAIEKGNPEYFEVKIIYQVIPELVREIKNGHISAWMYINDFKWALYLSNQREKLMLGEER